MSLIGALNVGRNALAAQQASLQVTTNNIANAGNPDYTRQSAFLTPNADRLDGSGHFLGTGVTLASVNRQIDSALLGRLRSALSDKSAADSNQSWISRVESVFNALGTNGLSSQMSTFFNSWSKLASNPQDPGLRQIVITNGGTLARSFNDVQRQLSGLREDLDNRIVAQATTADDLTKQIAELNGRITVTEGAGGNIGGQANALRDQRDSLVKQLSGLMDVSTTEDRGSLNVFVGSQPLVIGTTSRGVGVKQTSDGTGVQTQLVLKDGSETPLSVSSGELGGLIAARTTAVDASGRLDTLSRSLVFELNKVHASGQGLTGLTSVSSTNPVSDPNAALDSPGAGLAFPPQNGSFVVTVRQKSTGLTTSKLIKIDLGPNAAPPTTLNSLAAQVADGSINTSVAGGQLSISAASSDVEISFSQDSSNVLASLGVNTFFTGTSASTMRINSAVRDNPQLLAAAQNGAPGDNRTALAIASLDTLALPTLSGLSLRQSYDTMVSSVSASTSAAKTTAEGTNVVLQTLEAQRESLSGVSLDEESINLIKQQRAFQGAARIISTVDDMLQTVLGLVR